MPSIAKGAQIHLLAFSERMAAFKDDLEMGFGPLVLASDLREVAAAATRAAEELESAHMDERGTT